MEVFLVATMMIGKAFRKVKEEDMVRPRVRDVCRDPSSPDTSRHGVKNNSSLDRSIYGGGGEDLVLKKVKAPARGVPADVMIVRQGSGVAQASGPNPMSFPSVNNR